MIDTDKYEGQLEDDNTDTWVVWQIAKESLAEVKRLREENKQFRIKKDGLRLDMAYIASVMQCFIDGHDLMSFYEVRDFALKGTGMTMEEAMATTDLELKE